MSSASTDPARGLTDRDQIREEPTKQQCINALHGRIRPGTPLRLEGESALGPEGARYDSRDGGVRVTHGAVADDSRDGGVRATHGAVADESRDGRGRAKQDARAEGGGVDKRRSGEVESVAEFCSPNQKRLAIPQGSTLDFWTILMSERRRDRQWMFRAA